MTIPRSRLEPRAYRPADQAAVIELWRACGLVVPLNDPARDIALCLDSGHGAIFVVGQDAEILASVMVGHDGHRGWLYYLAVRPGERLHGLGRRLVRHAEDWLAGQGLAKVQLMIRESNTEVTAFYRRLGYAVEPRTVMSRRLDGKNPARDKE